MHEMSGRDLLSCECIFLCVLCCLMFIDIVHIHMQLMQRMGQLNEYVCMYVYIYVHTCVCMYVRTYIHTYVCMYVFMYVCMYVSLFVGMYVCIYVYMYVCMYVFMYVCIFLNFIYSMLHCTL